MFHGFQDWLKIYFKTKFIFLNKNKIKKIKIIVKLMFNIKKRRRKDFLSKFLFKNIFENKKIKLLKYLTQTDFLEGVSYP